MCLRVIAASDHPLPEVSWGPASPLFGALPLKDDAAALRLLPKPYLLELVSIVGCGCDFRYSPDDLNVLGVPDDIQTQDEEAYEQRRESVARLREYLRRAVQTAPVEVYCCWTGEEQTEPETRRTVTPTHFGGEAFGFVEKQLLTVVPEALS